jgi:hypothetical protein
VKKQYLFQTRDIKKIHDIFGKNVEFTLKNHFYEVLMFDEELPLFRDYKVFELGYILNDAHQCDLKPHHFYQWFNLSECVFGKFKYRPKNILDALSYYLIAQCKEKYDIRLPVSFINSRLYQTSINHLLRDYFVNEYRDEKRYMNDSPIMAVMKLFYVHIGIERLDILKELSYQIVTLLYD